MLFRMMRAGMDPSRMAATMQLLAAQTGQYPLMSPALYSQLVAPEAAPDVYATMASERLGRESLGTRRYESWLGARSALDQAAMNARQQALANMITGLGQYWTMRPNVPTPESPYAAAQQGALASYQYANVGQQAEAMRMDQLRRAQLTQAIIQAYNDPNATPEQRQQYLSYLIALNAQQAGT